MPKPPHQPALLPRTEAARAAQEVADLQETAQRLRAVEILSIVTGLEEGEAREILQRVGGFAKLAQLSEHALRALPYIGPARAKKIRALTEWALLLHETETEQPLQVTSPADVARVVMLPMSLLEEEHLRVMGLDTKNRVVCEETVYKGSINTAVVRIAEILRMPLALKCAAMIIIHNHPSGDPTPSPEDVRVTEMIRDACNLLDIDLLDHLVIGRNRYVSLKERGLAFG